MTRYLERRWLPVSCEEIFELVAAVERYPEFLPGWLQAKVLSREGETLQVEQRIDFGIVERRFHSTAQLRKPHSVHIHSRDPPFRWLDISWRFEPDQAGSGCYAELAVDLALQSAVLGRLCGPFIRGHSRSLIGLFERRARALHGGRSGAQWPAL